MAAHSVAFLAVRNALVELNEDDRSRLGRLFGAMGNPQVALGPEIRDVLRSLATLDDRDLERLVAWFTAHVNRWGQMPGASGLKIRPT